LFKNIATRKSINLLTGKYLEQAQMCDAAVKIAALEVAIFLICVLVVSSMLLTVNLMQAAVHRNVKLLADPDAIEAESISKLAAAARIRSENATRYFSEENIEISFLGAVAAKVSEGLVLNELEMNNREQSIYVRGMADSVRLFTEFVGRLEAGGIFQEINVAELERGEERVEFLLELKPESGL